MIDKYELENELIKLSDDLGEFEGMISDAKWTIDWALREIKDGIAYEQ